jgi:branched-chain amino acid transport system substrate-binding protein
MRRGAALAVQEINARGGVGGRLVEHVIAEVSGQSRDEVAAALAQLRDMEVDAITLGNVSPRLGVPAISEAAEYSAPLMHSMVSPALTEHVHDNPGHLGRTFQVCASETAYLTGFLRTLDALAGSGQWRPPSPRIVVVARSVDAPEVADLLDAASTAGGWQLVDFIPVDDVGVPWESVIARIVRLDPAAVFVRTYVESELATCLRMVNLSGISPLLFAVWTPSIPDFADRMGSLAEGLLWSTVIGSYDDPISGSFLRRYRHRYGAAAGTGSAPIHYDMVNMFASAWARVDRPWDFGAVAEELRTGVHRGVAGPYFFGGRGQRALTYPDDTLDASLAHAHLIHQIQSGVSRLIGPQPLSSGTFRDPGSGTRGPSPR